MSDTNTLLGRPIQGTINRYTSRDNGPQLGPEEFLARLDAVFATGQVSAVGWNQYTPYFNDGDACEFGTGEVYAFPTPELDPDNYAADEDVFEYYDESYKGMAAISTYTYPGSKPDPRVSAETIAAIKAFHNFRPFQDMLLDTFGDPSKVIATPEGFQVEFFDHD